MIPLQHLSGATFAVFGLGASGRATVRALAAGGAEVAAWDDARGAREAARAEGLGLVDLERADFAAFDALVLSPGVPLTHPQPHWTVTRARESGVPVIGDTELFVAALAASGTDARLVAITGTNGKSTTTALTGHVLRQAGVAVEVGGNIGRAVLELAAPADGLVYVIEFSSYQIDLTPSLAPDVAVLLNLSPDHLDRHGDFETYAAVKERIFARQESDQTAIVGVDDEASVAIAERLAARRAVTRVSGLGRPDGQGARVFAADGWLWGDDGDGDGDSEKIVELATLETLRGNHNWQNAAAAAAAARALGVDRAAIAAGLRSFPGLAHRMEQVGRRGETLFINDSKATNADAAARALASFETIYWIAGGLPKSGGIAGLERYFERIARAYLIGEAAEAFASTLEGRVDHVQCGTLERAVEAAARDAGKEGRTGAVVLLSPACASFDQFANFEVRGDAFRDLVAGLDGIAMTKEAAA